MSEKRPIHEIRLGRIKAAIWQNETEHGPRFSVAITRIYRSEERWETSSSFGRDDLPLVSKVADLTHTWIYQHANDNGGQSSSDSNAEEKSEAGRRRTTATEA